jgi:hypothetical protein
MSAGVAVGALAGRAGAGSPEGGRGPGTAPAKVHVVRSGETLWGLAQGLAGPQGDPRPIVDRLISANHLHGEPLQPGERLVVPND